MVDLSEVKGSGFIGSFALHGLVLAMVAMSWETMSWKNQAPPRSLKVVAVNLVRLSDQSTSPASPQTAPVPQDKSGTVPQSEAAQVALAPIVAAPQPQPLIPIQPAAPHPGAIQKPKLETNSPKVVVKPVSPSTATTARAHELSPDERLTTHLKLLADLPRSVRPTSNNVRQGGIGMSNVTAANPNTVRSRYATYAVTEARHHSLNAAEGSQARVAAYPPKRRSKHSNEYSRNEYSPKTRQAPSQMLTITGAKADPPATARSSAQATNAIGAVGISPAGSVAASSNGTAASSSSSTASAGNSDGGNGSSAVGAAGSSPASSVAASSSGTAASSSSSPSSGSGTHGASATHGASLGGVGGVASGVGHAGVGAAGVGAAGVGAAGHGGGRGGGGR